jgi:hypothetical protein
MVYIQGLFVVICCLRPYFIPDSDLLRINFKIQHGPHATPIINIMTIAHFAHGCNPQNLMASISGRALQTASYSLLLSITMM